MNGADIVGAILLVLFFGSFIGACAGLGRTTKPPPSKTDGPEKPD